MTSQEPLQSYQPQSMFSTWIGVVLLFAFFGLLALVVFRASPRGDDYEAKRAKVRTEKLEAAQKETMTALTTYGWVDKTKGVARIPIDHAMKLTVADLAQKKPAPANPIAAAEQSPAPATSPAASPAASAGGSPAAGPAASPAAKASATPAPTPSITPKPSAVTGHDSTAHEQPAAATNPPPAPPGTQPGPAATPAASPPSAPAKAQVSPTASPTPSAPASPLPVRGKTP